MAISEDTGNQPVPAHTATGSPVTTASFSPQAGTLLVAMFGANGPSGTAITATITDSLSGGWTLLKRQNTSTSMGGTAEVWCRYLSSAPGSMTVTSTWTGADTGANLVVRSLLGAASVQNGATAANGGASIAPNVSLTPTQIGSWIYGALVDWTASTTMVNNANTTIIDQFNDLTNGDTYAAIKANSATSSLSATSYGCTNVNAAFNLAFVEILAAPSADPAPLQPLFLPGDDPFSGLQPWTGAPDDPTHNVIVNAGTASIGFLTPSFNNAMLLLALENETGKGANAITINDPDALLDPLLTPDDVTGGMQPWGGAPDSVTVAATTANAGAASIGFTAQGPSAALSVLPGTGTITVAADSPTAAVAALPGASSVTLTAQAPVAALAPVPGAAAVSITAQTASVGIAPTAGAASVTFAGKSALAGPGGVAGVASITFTAQTASVGISPGAGVASVSLSAQAPVAGVSALPGQAALTITGQGPTTALGALPGTAAVTTAAQPDTGSLGALPSAAPVNLSALGAFALAVDGITDPSVPLFLPDDPYGGMVPWTGAPDGIITNDAAVNAGVASITIAAQNATAGISPSAGTATMSISAQSVSAALSALPGTSSITLTADSPTAAMGALPGTATASLTARAPSASLAALPSASSIIFTADQASVPGTTIANAGVASISVTARAPVAGIAPTAGSALVVFTASSALTSLASLPGTAVVSMSAQGTSVVLPQTGTPTVISGRQPIGLISGKEGSSSFSGSETGLISGKQPLSSTSGTEPTTSVQGREPHE